MYCRRCCCDPDFLKTIRGCFQDCLCNPLHPSIFLLLFIRVIQSAEAIVERRNNGLAAGAVFRLTRIRAYQVLPCFVIPGVIQIQPERCGEQTAFP